MASPSRFKLHAGKHGGIGEPVALMGFVNQVLPGTAGVFLGPGALIFPPFDGQRALPPTRSD
jgi:hypothetical protein